jgi:hypothetical protein
MNFFLGHVLLAVRPMTSPSIQFLNSTANATVRPIIFQKNSNNTVQPQLLTVMPAGVRVQQLTPVVRSTNNQAATIVRLMSPVTSAIRPGTNAQQIFQLNSASQQQTPLVIKAITANRPQQSIVLNAGTQQKTIISQSQGQQVVLLNQNMLNVSNNAMPSTQMTLQMMTMDRSTESTATELPSSDRNLPQLDGTYDSDTENNDKNEQRNGAQISDTTHDHPLHKLQIDGSIDEPVSSP